MSSGEDRGALKGYEWLSDELRDPGKNAVVAGLMTVADDLGCSMAQLALAESLAGVSLDELSIIDQQIEKGTHVAGPRHSKSTKRSGRRG